jgi:hypothetical protein
MTRLVNIRKEKCDVYIGRGSKWGNPFTHITNKKTLAEHIVATRKEAIDNYRTYLLNNPELLNSLEELRGKTLGCFCKPKSCHGDIILELLSKHKLF